MMSIRRRTPLALQGQSREIVEERLRLLRTSDRTLMKGVKFGRRFFGGDIPFELAEYASGLFAQSTRTALYADLPGPASVEGMHREIVGHALDLLQAPPAAAGVVTSGGTESVILALKAAVGRARSRGLAVHEMEVVAPQSAHPCIDKAAELLNVRLLRVPVRSDFTANVAEMAAAVSPNTVMLYCSFPSYAFGLADDVQALGALATSKDVWLHVDACLSGLLAPFARMNGEIIPPFDFEIPGVSSLSADLHKHGYSAKGASLILFRDSDLARFATFSYTNHPLAPMTTVTLAGTASGAPIASAWAVMQHLGVAGYRELAARLFASRRAIVAAINSVPGFAVLGQPQFSIVVLTSSIYNLEKVRNVLTHKQWFTAPVFNPSGIHMNVGAFDQQLAEELVRDITEAAEKSHD